ncbi:hypothetical protein FIBSPDRAFT_936908 [Athelia psychrophila]|uniref:Uncharacterized protein n=1 Tax=Athelia psychrophila TaxID=1759441 RepID=A0A166B9Y7_9AGAM|nr:hypothetical protein FIBSPDRAFT_936908 [Fibularhizoctonia sp. CBS 109695]
MTRQREGDHLSASLKTLRGPPSPPRKKHNIPRTGTRNGLTVSEHAFWSTRCGSRPTQLVVRKTTFDMLNMRRLVFEGPGRKVDHITYSAGRAAPSASCRASCSITWPSQPVQVTSAAERDWTKWGEGYDNISQEPAEASTSEQIIQANSAIWTGVVPSSHFGTSSSALSLNVTSTGGDVRSEGRHPSNLKGSPPAARREALALRRYLSKDSREKQKDAAYERNLEALISNSATGSGTKRLVANTQQLNTPCRVVATTLHKETMGPQKTRYRAVVATADWTSCRPRLCKDNIQSQHATLGDQALLRKYGLNFSSLKFFFETSRGPAVELTAGVGNWGAYAMIELAGTSSQTPKLSRMEGGISDGSQNTGYMHPPRRASKARSYLVLSDIGIGSRPREHLHATLYNGLTLRSNRDSLLSSAPTLDYVYNFASLHINIPQNNFRQSDEGIPRFNLPSTGYQKFIAQLKSYSLLHMRLDSAFCKIHGAGGCAYFDVSIVTSRPYHDRDASAVLTRCSESTVREVLRLPIATREHGQKPETPGSHATGCKKIGKWRAEGFKSTIQMLGTHGGTIPKTKDLGLDVKTCQDMRGKTQNIMLPAANFSKSCAQARTAISK